MSHIILQHWVAGRACTPGRFWRTVRRIDSRSVDLVTATTRLIMLVLALLVIVGSSL
jgi:hypothetical protein